MNYWKWILFISRILLLSLSVLQSRRKQSFSITFPATCFRHWLTQDAPSDLLKFKNIFQKSWKDFRKFVKFLNISRNFEKYYKKFLGKFWRNQNKILNKFICNFGKSFKNCKRRTPNKSIETEIFVNALTKFRVSVKFLEMEQYTVHEWILNKEFWF